MLIVTDLSGKTEALTNIKNAEVNEEINGDFSLSFTTILSEKNAHSYPLLQNESIVELDGHGFRVKKLGEIRNKKDVIARHIFFDLIEHQVYGFIGGTKSADDIFSFILAGTGWTFENMDVDNFAVLSNFGENNAIKLIRDACQVLNCEIKVMPGKRLKIYKQIGADTDNQFRYGHNVKTLKNNVDTDNLRTIIKGFGANGLEVTYRSTMADIYGERHAEPVRDDRYTSAASLTDRVKQELNDVPDVSIEVEVTQLDFEPGLGDRLWTIYEPIVIDIKTRIASRKWFPFTNRSPTVTLENKRRAFSDILTQTRAEISENKKEYRSKFDQTNEKISFEVERLDGDITEAKAQIEINANSIVSSVQEIKTETAEQINQANTYAENQAEGAFDNAKGYADGLIVTVNTRITDAESSITQLADSITSKVDAVIYETGIADAKIYAELQASGALGDAKTYTDNGIAPVVTRITDAESSITQLSNSIESRVAESVSVLEGDISDLQGDLSGLGTRIYNAESTITQQSGLISSKVEQTDFNGNTIISKVNQSATVFEIDANKINMLGITTVNRRLNLGEAGDYGEKLIAFSNNASIATYNSTSMEIDAFGFIHFAGDVKFSPYYGGSAIDVDFTGANVKGLSVTYANSAGYADNAGYAYSSGSSTYADYVGGYGISELIRGSSGQRLYISLNGAGSLIVTHADGRYSQFSADYTTI